MLIETSAESEERTLTIVGMVLLVCLAVVGLLVVSNPFAGRASDLISVVIDTPYVGQGVAKGTPVVLHGVEIGKVTGIRSLAGRGVRLDADIEKHSVAGFTDTMDIDFRPINYFGVTGVNLMASSGGQPLRDGSHVKVLPKGNFTIQALLSRLGQVSTGVLTAQLIQVIDRATRYTDALNPLIETGLIVSNTIAQVQTVSTAKLLTNTTGLSVAFPGVADALINTGFDILHNDLNYRHMGSGDFTQDQWDHQVIPVLEIASKGLFYDIDRLEGSHLGDLLPITDTVKALTDVVPPLIRPEGFAELLANIRTRFEKMYGGTPDQRAIQTRIVLDRLPGVAAPLGAMGGP